MVLGDLVSQAKIVEWVCRPITSSKPPSMAINSSMCTNSALLIRSYNTRLKYEVSFFQQPRLFTSMS
jgi:hypothetical protein